MPRFQRTKRINHTAKNAFDLVANVKAYPEFVPMCRAVTVSCLEKLTPTQTVFMADMTVGNGVVIFCYTSRVLLDYSGLTISVEHVGDKFKYLRTKWRFVDASVNDQSVCDIHFSIAYDLKNRFFSYIVKSYVDEISQKMVTVFEKRADEIYGKVHKSANTD